MQQYVSASTALLYPISFGNEANASANAQTVVITDPLNTSTDDLTTFSFGPISVAGQTLFPPLGTSYSTTVDLRPGTNLLVGVAASLDANTGIATWKFTSIDPATGLPTTNPTAGFLPPGANGSVFFTVMPKPNVTTGTQVQNQATIVFDANPPMATPTWLNTFDVTPPSSHVQPLPATASSSSFVVQWQGTDVGSGIKDYTIYASVDGAPFAAWLTNTTATSATYAGQAGHNYGFYSLARDGVDNVEATKASPDTSTQVTLPTAATPVFSVVPGTYNSPQTVTISDTTVGATIYYTTDRTAPTTNSTQYGGAITVSSSETINAIAIAPGYTQSALASASYTITPPTTVAGTVQLITTAALSKVAGGYQALVTVRNTGTGTASNVQLTTALLGSAGAGALPITLGNLAPGGGSAVVTLTFPVSAGASGAMVLEKLNGTYSGGTFGGSLRATLP